MFARLMEQFYNMRRLLEKHHRAEQMWILSLVKNTTLANLLQKNNNIFFL